MAKEPAFDTILADLTKNNPNLQFVAGDCFYWSPAKRQVYYKQAAEGQTAVYSLLHEVGHGLLAHKRYKLDFELLQLEVAAWEHAKQLGAHYGITISEDHIQDCLDSYRDWLYRRSICPSCTAKALQQDDQPMYRCFNCHTTWHVTPSRFCRPYRHQQNSNLATLTK